MSEPKAPTDPEQMQHEIDLLETELWAIYTADENNWYARVIQSAVEDDTQ
jgi:hypothetical protein